MKLSTQNQPITVRLTDKKGSVARASLTIFLASILLLANSSAVMGQTTTATLHFSQTIYAASVDAQLVVGLAVEDVEQIGAWEVTLQYDPAFLSLSTLNATEFLSSTGRVSEVLGPSDTGAAGEVRIGAFSYGATEAVSGSGTLAEIRFDVLQAGETTLQIGEAVLATSVMGDVVELTPQVTGAMVDISPSVDVLDVTIDSDDIQNAIVIVWQSPASAASYEVLRSERPYFDRGDVNATDISSSCSDNGGTVLCTDLTGGGGQTTINHYYLISIFDQSSQLVVDHRLAEFDLQLGGAS